LGVDGVVAQVRVSARQSQNIIVGESPHESSVQCLRLDLTHRPSLAQFAETLVQSGLPLGDVVNAVETQRLGNGLGGALRGGGRGLGVGSVQRHTTARLAASLLRSNVELVSVQEDLPGLVGESAMGRDRSRRFALGERRDT
ncbi:hypothetical protein PENTCL1PPCAC_1333, partial [Pristionchus entomophagus]